MPSSSNSQRMRCERESFRWCNVSMSMSSGAKKIIARRMPGDDTIPDHACFIEGGLSEPRIARLDWIETAVELTQITESADCEPIGIALTGFKQRGHVVPHLLARGRGLRGRAVRQEIVGQHDAFQGGFHDILSVNTKPPLTPRA